MIASSVPKLGIGNVAVMDSSGHLFSRLEEGENAGGTSDEQYMQQRRIESQTAEKVQTLLEKVVGVGQVVVRVSAQLNLERVERNVLKIDPDSQVIMEEATRSDDSGGGKSGAGGVVSVAPATSEAAGAAGTSARKQKTVSNRYNYNTTTEHVTPEVGGIKRLSVAVLVAAARRLRPTRSASRVRRRKWNR